MKYILSLSPPSPSLFALFSFPSCLSAILLSFSLPTGCTFSKVLKASLRGHQSHVKGLSWDPIGRLLASQVLLKS